METYDLVIIGGGPAGMTAAIYGARAALKTLIIERGMPGGQVATTFEIANYPGFPQGTTGPDLAMAMFEQAQNMGAEFLNGEITAMDLQGELKKIEVGSTNVLGKTVILATGSEPRKLGVPGENKFRGRGVSYCATCDGAFFKDKDVVVVGGGDAAVEEGLYLTRFARKVTIVHRRDKLRANAAAQRRAFANEKISFVWNTVVEEILGDISVTGVRVKNLEKEAKGEPSESVLNTDGVFIYIGQIPNVEFFPDSLKRTPEGYIETDEHLRTNIPGVFAAGDVRDTVLRQLVTATADGAIAAMSALHYLESKE